MNFSLGYEIRRLYLPTGEYKIGTALARGSQFLFQLKIPPLAERLCETDLWKTQQGTVRSITNIFSLVSTEKKGLIYKALLILKKASISILNFALEIESSQYPLILFHKNTCRLLKTPRFRLQRTLDQKVPLKKSGFHTSGCSSSRSCKTLQFFKEQHVSYLRRKVSCCPTNRRFRANQMVDIIITTRYQNDNEVKL